MKTIELRGLELVGAYGRTTLMDDWYSGKDFKIVGGPYCSIRDVDEMIAEGFNMLEFMQDGVIVKRIILDEALDALIKQSNGIFSRV